VKGGGACSGASDSSSKTGPSDGKSFTSKTSGAHTEMSESNQQQEAAADMDPSRRVSWSLEKLEAALTRGRQGLGFLDA